VLGHLLKRLALEILTTDRSQSQVPGDRNIFNEWTLFVLHYVFDLMTKPSAILFVLFSFMLISSMSTTAQKKVSQNSSSNALDKDLAVDKRLIDSFREARNLDGLVRAADNLERKWRPQNRSYYAEASKTPN
jgi:hypothetical protein